MRVLIIILVFWPWRFTWLPTVLKAPLYTDRQLGAAICEGQIACTTVGTPTVVFVSRDRADWVRGGGLAHMVIHELQHYLQIESGLRESADWQGFSRAVDAMILSNEYSDHERNTMLYLRRCAPLEMHAELPALLRGKMPPELQPWYPWFELGGAH